MERFSKLSIVIILFALLAGFFAESLALRDGEHLPYRQELATDVKFWKKVFTEVSSNQYIIHDSQHLSVIYTIVSFDSTVNERIRQRHLKRLKEKYEELLNQFHYSQKDTTNLQLWEQRVFDQFKLIQEEDKFQKAIRRIRAQQGIREAFETGLRRSFAYLPMMREIFQRYDLPEELVFMPHIESSFNIHAGSRAGAKGMWQFMWSTARYYMRINNLVDQRFDPIYSTEAAARLLKRNYQDLHDWALAITAYNHGLAGMKRAKAKFGGDYLKIREGYLKRSFGFASKNFYPEFLAAVEIMDSLDYYFPNIEQHPPFSFTEIELPKTVNIRQFAKALNLNIAELRELNPSYKNVVWSGQMSMKKGYWLRLPVPANTQRALAYLGAGTPPVAKAETEIAANMKQADALVPVSFTKPFVSPGEGSTVNAPDMLDENARSMTSMEIIEPRLVMLSKPGIQTGDETRYDLDMIDLAVQPAGPPQPQTAAVAAQDGAPGLDEMPALALGKPRVDDLSSLPVITADVFAVAYQQNNVPAIAQRAVEPEESATSTLPEVEPEEGYEPTPTAQHSITIAEIRDILAQRLGVEGNTIVVFPNETIGHVAEWLEVSAGYLRSLNGLRYGSKLYSGQILKLDFPHVSQEQFLMRRVGYHVNLIEEMLEGKSEVRLVEHTVNPGENLWSISRKRYNFPANLLLYFNDVNKLEQLYPGDTIKLPMI